MRNFWNNLWKNLLRLLREISVQIFSEFHEDSMKDPLKKNLKKNFWKIFEKKSGGIFVGTSAGNFLKTLLSLEIIFLNINWELMLFREISERIDETNFWDISENSVDEYSANFSFGWTLGRISKASKNYQNNFLKNPCRKAWRKYS